MNLVKQIHPLHRGLPGDGLPRAQLVRGPLSRRGLEGYIFLTGQPVEVRQAFLAAMGFNSDDFTAPADPYDPLSPAPR